MSSSPFRIAVFASGSGSNFQAIADAVKAGQLDVRIELLVCDRPKAKVVERAQAAGVPVHAFRPKDYESREHYEQEILAQLQEKQVDLIVMAGYMRLITSVLVKPFYGRLINVHPSLLPAFPGVNAIGQALDYGVKVTGVTVHFVDGGMDTGPIIAQAALEIQPGDTEETVAERVHRIEHKLYPQVIGWIRDGKVRLNGRHVERV
ncbi:phosphoribosylglycinamide formyltransferase [Paenibacillus sp. tmac-D7]|nr:phosphoribosylglycinamide formyltransferase [Paenibacillus sp. tmac-D7]